MFINLKKQMIRISFMVFILLSGSLGAQEHNWNSPAEVVKEIKEKFKGISSYTAKFSIETATNIRKKSVKSVNGTCYYKSSGKVRYEFQKPAGDLIVSDGKTLWIYIKSKNAVGKQDLTIQKKNKAGKLIFSANSKEGLYRLFRKYHYKFDSTKQPRKGEDGNLYFVLDLEQREKIGGFENILLFVDAKTYLIKKAIASDSRGKTTTLEFSNIALNQELEDGLFKYHISGNSKIVNNPLVSDNQ